jgi:hypothetical protein
MSGASEVAALLATAVEWAYMDLPIAARQRFGVPSGSSEELAAQAEIARGLLEDPTGIGRRLVWSYNDVEPLLETFQSSLMDTELPLMVFLRIPAGNIEYIANQLARSSDAAMIETVQTRVRRILDQRGDDRSIIMDVPELPIEPGGLYDGDLLLDTHVQLALEVAEWLHIVHGGPSLSELPGTLGDLWRLADPRMT